jgi:endonuclease YncB( thermonuclease family)
MGRLLTATLLAGGLAALAYAHSGGLDANGGHWDLKAGTYHVHRPPAAVPAPQPAPLPIPLAPNAPAAAVGAEFSGLVVAVTDGDTIQAMRGGKAAKIRLNGIDAPESAQAYGQKAKDYLAALCFGAVVRIAVRDVDRYGRLVGDVYSAKGAWLNLALVRAGLAWHYKAYSRDRTLAAAELAARTGRLGLWRDKAPVAPWDWRRRK